MLITTFPRSGLHFLYSSINLNYNIKENINKTHTPICGKNAVTIIRNPKECISSAVAMDIALNVLLDLSEKNIVQQINYFCKGYIESIKYYHQHIKEIYPIKFDDFALDHNLEIKKLLDHYNIKYNYKKNLIEVEDTFGKKFVASSKQIKEYDKIYELTTPLIANAELAYSSMIDAINNKEHIS